MFSDTAVTCLVITAHYFGKGLDASPRLYESPYLDDQDERQYLNLFPH